MMTLHNLRRQVASVPEMIQTNCNILFFYYFIWTPRICVFKRVHTGKTATDSIQTRQIIQYLQISNGLRFPVCEPECVFAFLIRCVHTIRYANACANVYSLMSRHFKRPTLNRTPLYCPSVCLFVSHTLLTRNIFQAA